MKIVMDDKYKPQVVEDRLHVIVEGSSHDELGSPVARQTAAGFLDTRDCPARFGSAGISGVSGVFRLESEKDQPVRYAREFVFTAKP